MGNINPHCALTIVGEVQTQTTKKVSKGGEKRRKVNWSKMKSPINRNKQRDLQDERGGR